MQIPNAIIMLVSYNYELHPRPTRATNVCDVAAVR